MKRWQEQLLLRRDYLQVAMTELTAQPNRTYALVVGIEKYQRIIGEYQIKLLIFNPAQEEIVIWRD